MKTLNFEQQLDFITALMINRELENTVNSLKTPTEKMNMICLETLGREEEKQHSSQHMGNVWYLIDVISCFNTACYNTKWYIGPHRSRYDFFLRKTAIVFLSTN